MLFGIGARGWGRVRRQRSRRRRTRSRARGRRTFVGFISPSSVGIVRGLTVLNSVRSSHAALPKGHVSRMRGTYTFTSRMFVRGTVQYVSTDRDPSLYAFSTLAKSGTVSGQVLLSYKL